MKSLTPSKKLTIASFFIIIKFAFKELGSANNDFIQASVCLLITSFLESLETICLEGPLLEWAKYYFISYDNISSVIEIYGCKVSAQQDGIWRVAALAGGGNGVMETHSFFYSK